MSRADNGAVPVAHRDIVAILETVRAGAVSDTLLALLKLFQEAKVSRNCSKSLDRLLVVV